jgi:hypothetical protein
MKKETKKKIWALCPLGRRCENTDCNKFFINTYEKVCDVCKKRTQGFNFLTEEDIHGKCC